MMDSANIQRAAELYQEIRQIDRALEVIDHSGTITAVILEAPNPDSPVNISITVPTEGLQYPPQMIAAIYTQLQDRRNAINHELEQIGVQPMQAAGTQRRG